MRETNFIKQNKEKWKRFEIMTKVKAHKPEELSKLFIQITDDLSYARTFYKNRSVRVYLNNLAQQVFYSIYKNKKAKRKSLFDFWTDELPQLMYESRKALLLSFSIFVLAVLIGSLSSAMNPEFPRVIMGDAYVDQTLRNISNGDPMAVYKSRNEIDMSFQITFNNLKVGFLTFISGLITSIGTIGILISNGIMLGAFQFFFYDQGVLRESLLTIWIHGTIEISTIILAGCAGITLGNGLLFPGTFSRMQSLQKSALRGLKIMIGIVPLIIMAGFIEGFVTRYTNAPDILRLGIILASLSFVLLYFVWLPWQKHKDGFDKPIKDTRIPPDRNIAISYQGIKANASVFTETFLFYRQHFSKISTVAFLLALAYTLLVFYQYELKISDYIYYKNGDDFWDWLLIQSFANLGQFFNYRQIPVLIISNTLFLGTMFYFAMLYFIKAAEKQVRYTWFFHLIGWTGTIALWGIFNMLVKEITANAIPEGFFIFMLSLLLFPLVLLWLVVMLKERKNPFKALFRTFSLLFAGFGRFYGAYFTTLFVSFLLCFVLNSPLTWLIIDTIGWNFALEAEAMAALMSGMLTFLFALTLCLVFPLFMISTALTYVSLKEIRDADGLKAKIQQIGVRKRAYGFVEREG